MRHWSKKRNSWTRFSTAVSMIHCAVHIACIYIYKYHHFSARWWKQDRRLKGSKKWSHSETMLAQRLRVIGIVQSRVDCITELTNAWVRSFNCAIDIVGCIAEHTMRVLSIVQSRVDCVAEHTRRLRNAWWHIVIALLFLCIAAMQTLRYARKLLYHSSVTNLIMKGTKKSEPSCKQGKRTPMKALKRPASNKPKQVAKQKKTGAEKEKTCSEKEKGRGQERNARSSIEPQKEIS